MGSLWNRSGTIERYGDDLAAAGAKAYFFVGGTTTPLVVYKDALEASAHPHPVVADARGRWPDIFVPYTVSYDTRVTTADNVQITYTLRIPNPDPVDLTVTIPAEEKVQTGMIHAEFIDAVKAGYVRLNGRTIGNAASGATERANNDTSALFTYLWTYVNEASAPVSGGKGPSPSADFTANKTIGLPDMRGAALTGLDTMGSTAAGRFEGLIFYENNSTTPASLVGDNKRTLSLAEMPSHTHAGTTGNNNVGHVHSGSTGTESVNHTHQYRYPEYHSIGITTGTTFLGLSDSAIDLATTTLENNLHIHSFTTAAESAPHGHDFTTSTVGSSSAFNNLPLIRLVTWYIKL